MIDHDKSPSNWERHTVANSGPMRRRYGNLILAKIKRSWPWLLDYTCILSHVRWAGPHTATNPWGEHREPAFSKNQKIITLAPWLYGKKIHVTTGVDTEKIEPPSLHHNISPFSVYRLMLDHPPLIPIWKGKVMLVYWERTIIHNSHFSI